ncbi:hypothetical protein GCM10023228_27730 [Brevibacillus fulvus]
MMMKKKRLITLSMATKQSIQKVVEKAKATPPDQEQTSQVVRHKGEESPPSPLITPIYSKYIMKTRKLDVTNLLSPRGVLGIALAATYSPLDAWWQQTILIIAVGYTFGKGSGSPAVG